MKAFETYHPIVLFTYFASVIGFAIFYMHPIFLVISFFASLLLNRILNKPSLKMRLVFYLPLFLVTTLANPMFSHNGSIVLFYVNYNAITLEAVLYGASLATMITSVILWFASYNSVMTSDKFLYLFGKLSPAIALIISMSLRLVPLFKKQLSIISLTQKTIGMDYSSGSLWHRMKCSVQIVSILITWSLENAIETADSMKARGYGLKNRSTFSLFMFTKRDGVLLVILFSLLVINISGSVLGYSTFYYYPTFSELTINKTTCFFYGSYACLLCIPIVIELREAIKWRSLKLKS